MTSALSGPREGPRQREAYREYLKLGLRRSYPDLHQRLTDLWVINVPSENTLRAWGTSFGWAARVVEDDEVINRRALDRLRERLSQDIEVRRSRRLQLADIQLSAATKAMVETAIDDDTGNEIQKPRDLLDMDPSMLRAINDTVRLAAETQRLDLGEATTRISGQESAQEHAVRTLSDSEMTEELMRFVGVANDEGMITIDHEEPLMLPDDLESES